MRSRKRNFQRSALKFAGFGGLPQGQSHLTPKGDPLFRGLRTVHLVVHLISKSLHSKLYMYSFRSIKVVHVQHSSTKIKKSGSKIVHVQLFLRRNCTCTKTRFWQNCTYFQKYCTFETHKKGITLDLPGAHWLRNWKHWFWRGVEGGLSVKSPLSWVGISQNPHPTQPQEKIPTQKSPPKTESKQKIPQDKNPKNPKIPTQLSAGGKIPTQKSPPSREDFLH